MQRYLYISLGGFIGAVLRYAIGTMPIYGYYVQFPVKTFFVNITGSFLIGLFFTIAANLWRIDDDVKYGVAIGFLGAYTTFSTFCNESVSLISKGFYISAMFYLLLSPILGLMAVWLGVKVARKLEYRFKRKDVTTVQ